MRTEQKIWVLRVSNPVIWATPRDNPRRPERESEHNVYWVDALQPRRGLVRRRLTPEDASPRGPTYELPIPLVQPGHALPEPPLGHPIRPTPWLILEYPGVRYLKIDNFFKKFVGPLGSPPSIL